MEIVLKIIFKQNLKITQNQKESDILIYNSDDINLKNIQTKTKKSQYHFYIHKKMVDT